MRLSLIGATVVALLSTEFAHAQEWSGDGNYSPAPQQRPARARGRGSSGFAARPVGKTWISIDPAFVLPLGEMSDRIGVGLGATASVQYSFKPRALVTFRTGYMIFMRKKSQPAGAYQIPMLVGLKYYMKPRLFFFPEFGLGISGVSGCASGVNCDNADSETSVAGALAVGWDFTQEINLRGGLFLPDIGDLGDQLGLYLALSWDIWSD